jgi:nucleosome binding factor SPN SPT16 subunit
MRLMEWVCFDFRADGQQIDCVCAQTNVGTLPKDKFTGKFVEEWEAFLTSSGTSFKTVDVSAALAGVMARKEEDEIVRSSCPVWLKDIYK